MRFSSRQRGAEETMAYVTYHRTDAVHATIHPKRKLAWGRLFALAATVGLWVGLIAGARAIF
jgi:hypothetical protein